MEVLRETVIVLAEREGAQAIAGTDARLRVTADDWVISPGKGTKERKALEAEFQWLGVWDKLAELGTHALEDAVKAGKWELEILEALKAHVSTEKRFTVTVSENRPQEKGNTN